MYELMTILAKKKNIAASTTRVTTGAFGRLNGIPLPFIGTNGTPACQKISSKDSRQLTGCNLNANEAYTYSNSFNVLQIYPSVRINFVFNLKSISKFICNINVLFLFTDCCHRSMGVD